MFLILKWQHLHSKNSAWLSNSSTCVAWNQSKFIDNWVRHAVMALWTWKMCVRGRDSSKKAECRVTRTSPSTWTCLNHPEGGCNMFLWNVRTFYHYMLHTTKTRPATAQWLLWKPEKLYCSVALMHLFFWSKKNFQGCLVTTITWPNTTTFEHHNAVHKANSQAQRTQKRFCQVSLKAFLKLKRQVLTKKWLSDNKHVMANS